jgi:dGTPase
MSAVGVHTGHSEGAYGECLKPGERAPAPYAASALASRGRRHPEPECPTRSPYQRDRDRIIHSTAFRRLIHKTQVFVYHEGDHYRTRLTHSLEVAQIARAVARQVRLDEDLAEALALAHDLGHSPFGHAGERALDAAMSAYGGFDHNAQSLRVVLQLERKYLDFDGLNPCWETLEGLAKHNGPVARAGTSALAKLMRALEVWQSLEPERWPSAEAQVAALSDDIAYLAHDIDDGLRAGLVALSDLETASDFTCSLARGALRKTRTREESRLTYEVTRRMITLMIADVVAETRRRLAALAPASPEDIRNAPAAVASFSPAMSGEIARLKTFLTARVYRSARVMRVVAGAEEIVTDLFTRYLADGAVLPDAWRRAAAGLPERRRARLIADFVAGMTDRYAIVEHERLFDATPELR